jgi:Putative Actinobacterial Holin-X, holin superfamily III
MATQVPTSSEPGSVSALVKGIVDDLGDPIKQQFAFARTEVKADLKKSKDAILALALGAGAALVGGLLVVLMLVHLLHWLTLPGPDPAGLPLWSCYAIVGFVFLGVGAALLLAGKKKFDSFNPLPDQTAEVLKENVSWMTNANNASSK